MYQDRAPAVDRALRVVVGAGLVMVSVLMGMGGYLWVLTSGILLLCGVALAVQGVFGLPSSNARVRAMHRFVLVMLVLFALVVLVHWYGLRHGIPFERALAVVIGCFALWLGIWPPDFLLTHAGYRALESAVGRLGTRALYVAIGVAFILLGLLGNVHGLLR